MSVNVSIAGEEEKDELNGNQMETKAIGLLVDLQPPGNYQSPQSALNASVSHFAATQHVSKS